MTNKQKILTHLAPYRDKTLSFGCEILFHSNRGGERPGVVTSELLAGLRIIDKVDDTPNVIVDLKIKESLGHPLTHADLLRALNDSDTEINGKENRKNYCLTTSGSLCVISPAAPMYHHILKIPLTHRTIEDIPEDDPMWAQLLEVFNLK